MDYFENVLEVVGNTPLIRMGRIERGEGIEATLLAKVEYLNPGGSVKDRPAVKMLEIAEKEGLLGPGGTVVEPTSGNTGAGLRGDLLDQARADVGVRFGGHHEHRLDLGIEVPVHQRHLHLVFEIGNR